jgi:pimeloyl-ACP methyl ester carboxylesterase
MIKQKIFINDIPAIRWGEPSKRLFLAVHGKFSHKEDLVIHTLAEEVIQKGYQLISFDLPEHGERVEEKVYPLTIQNAVSDLKCVLDYSSGLSEEISLFACSLGAYFSLMAYKDYVFRQALFLSPVVNMLSLIRGMMMAEGVSEELLKEKRSIETSFGEIIEWDYYDYVKNNPVSYWKSRTSILYGEGDKIVSKKEIEEFCEMYSSQLHMLKGSEHFFHTEHQLSFFRRWLKAVVLKRVILTDPLTEQL